MNAVPAPPIAPLGPKHQPLDSGLPHGSGTPVYGFRYGSPRKKLPFFCDPYGFTGQSPPDIPLPPATQFRGYGIPPRPRSRPRSRYSSPPNIWPRGSFQSLFDDSNF